MAARRTVVVGGLLALALAASAVLLAGQPASRPGAGRAPARTPAVTLVFGRLLPPATCDPRHCFAPRDLRRLKEQAYFDTVFHMPNQGVGGVKAAPPMVLGRHGSFRIRLRPGCYAIAVLPDYADGLAPSLMPLFDYELLVGTHSPETAGLRPLPPGALGPCDAAPLALVWPGRGAQPS